MFWTIGHFIIFLFIIFKESLYLFLNLIISFNFNSILNVYFLFLFKITVTFAEFRTALLRFPNFKKYRNCFQTRRKGDVCYAVLENLKMLNWLLLHKSNDKKKERNQRLWHAGLRQICTEHLVMGFVLDKFSSTRPNKIIWKAVIDLILVYKNDGDRRIVH